MLVLASTSPVHNAQGNIIGALGMFVDITDRKKAEENLRASEALYRAIARSIPNGGIHVVDKDLRYLVAEGSVSEAFGFTREMLEGHTVYEIFTGEHQNNLEKRLALALNGETVSSEVVQNGRVYWSQYAPLIDSIGQALIVTLDITERKQMEEALRKSKERYRNLFDLVPTAVYTCDADGVIQEYNYRATELWGRVPNQEETKEKYCGSYKIYYPDGSFMPLSECPMARVLAGELPASDEFEILIERPDGSRRNVIAHPLPVRNENGEIIEAINCLYDISDHRETEKALRENERQLQLLNETLEQKVKERTAEVRRLASDLTRAEQRERQRISHILHEDLQQRLYAIQMQMVIMSSAIQEPAFHTDFQDLQGQLDELISVTRHLSIDLSPPILHDEGLTQAISWLTTQMSDQHGLKINLQANGPFIVRDKDLQVLLFNCVRELLFNVVKHANTFEATVRLEWLNSGLRVEVHDNGSGFNVSGNEKIEMEVVDEENPSFGIPTIRHQLSLFGGFMDIQSQPGAGTHITIIVPIHEQEL